MAGAAALDGSAAGAVIGSTDPDASAAFLGAFGLEAVGAGELDADAAAALYGLQRRTTTVELATTRVGTGTPVAPSLWIVHCDDPGRAPSGFERRARALDIYTSCMDDAIEHLRFVGLAPGPVGTLEVGPVRMRQCLVAGPDSMSVVLVESSHRRSSLLDGDQERLFSEGHSVVWCVDSMQGEAELLAGAGLTRGMDLSFCEPEVSTYLGLPRSPVPIRMTMLSGETVDPLRLELLEFPEDPGDPVAPDRVTGGIWAMRYRADDPHDAARLLEAAGCVRTGATADLVALCTPGGIRLQVCSS